MPRLAQAIGLALCLSLIAVAPASANKPLTGTISYTGGETSGTVSGNYFSDNGTADIYFQIAAYGPSGPGQWSAPLGFATYGTGSGQASAPVSGLQPGTNYYVRMVASNVDGETTGGEQTIKTPGTPPGGPPTYGTPQVRMGGAGSYRLNGDRAGPVGASISASGVINPQNRPGGPYSTHFQWSLYPDFRFSSGPNEGSGDLGGTCGAPTPPANSSDHPVAAPDCKIDDREVSAGLRTLYVRLGYSPSLFTGPGNNGCPQTAPAGTQSPMSNTCYSAPVSLRIPDSGLRPAGGPGGGAGGGGGGAASALFAGLSVKGKAAKIATLLKKGFYNASFTAPGPGKAAISWYQVPKGAKLSAKKKPVLVAKGSKRATKAGKIKVKIKLTKKGKKMLKKVRRGKSLKLTAKGTFTPTGGKTAKNKRGFKLKR